MSKHKGHPWWTTLEIAIRWKVSRRTVQRRTHTGELPIVKISPRVNRVSAAALEAYERDHEVLVDGDAA
jgi:excisionase family DNA binding protein